jgi:hypothetical protein
MKFTAAGNCPSPGKPGKFRRGRRHLLGACLAVSLALLCSCGELRPLPAAIEPQGYTAIDYQGMLYPRQAGLQAGQMVRVKAYFWQFLDYDPAMVRIYLSVVRHPLGWPRLRWFAVYGSEEMKGYYDLAALDASRLHLYKLSRLDPIMIYGQLSSLGPGFYLHVHHVEKMVED